MFQSQSEFLMISDDNDATNLPRLRKILFKAPVLICFKSLSEFLMGSLASI